MRKRGLLLAGILISLFVLISLNLVYAQPVTVSYSVNRSICRGGDLASPTNCTTNVSNSDNNRFPITNIETVNPGFINGTWDITLPASAALLEVIAIFESQFSANDGVIEWYFKNNTSGNYQAVGCPNGTLGDPINTDKINSCNLTTIYTNVGSLQNIKLENKLTRVAGGKKNYAIDYFAVNITYIPDVVPPQITIVSPQNITYSVSNIDFNLSLNENTSWCGFSLDNAANVSMIINSSLTGASYLKTGLSVGSHNIIFSCNDSAGNMNSTQIRYFSIDNAAPSLNIVYPQNTSYNVNVTNLNYTVSDTNLQTCWYSTNNGQTNLSLICGNNVTSLTSNEGSNTWEVWANDSLGNMNSTSVTFYVDSIAPTISIIKPEEKTYGYNISLPLNYTASDLNLQSCWYKIANSTNNLIADNITIPSCQNITFSIPRDDSYILTLYTNDTLGNLNSASRNFSVSTTIAVSLEAPSNNAWLNYNSVSFNYTINSVATINNCSLWGNSTGVWHLNQTNLSAINITGGVNSFSLNLQDGSYIWNVFCSNTYSAFALNNYTLNIDAIAPFLSLTQPSGSKTSRTVFASWIVSDTNLQACWYNVTWSTGGLIISNNSINCYLNSTSFDVSADGSYIFNFYANDSAGNLNSSSNSFSVSTTSPPPSDGGSSGGGGGGGTANVSKLANLEISGLDDLIMNIGESRTLSAVVKNTGKIFLNKCKLSGGGQFSSWVSSKEIKGIAIGEISEFIFDLKVPSDMKAGDYPVDIFIICQEIQKSKSFKVSILNSSFQVTINKIEQKNNMLNVLYSVKDNYNRAREVSASFQLLDDAGEIVNEGADSFSLDSGEEVEREINLELPARISGQHVFRITASSEATSVSSEESVLLGGGFAGLAIFNQAGGKLLSYIILIAAGIFFVFVIIRRIIKNTGKQDRSGFVKVKLRGKED